MCDKYQNLACWAKCISMYINYFQLTLLVAIVYGVSAPLIPKNNALVSPNPGFSLSFLHAP